MSLLDEVANRLVAQSVGTIGSNIFRGSKSVIPEGDGPYLLLTETGGTGALRTHGGTPVARPGVNVNVRAKSYKTARTMMVAAFNALGGDNGLHNITLSGCFYQSLTPRGSIADIGLDENKRPMLSLNYMVMKQPS